MNSGYNHVFSFSFYEEILPVQKEAFGELLEAMKTTSSISKEIWDKRKAKGR